MISGLFVMDMTTIKAEGMSDGKNKKLTKHLKSEDFFHTSEKKNKTATLAITELKNGKAKGTLTVKGKALPIDNITYTQTGNKFTGTMVFNRAAYGVTYGSKSYFKKLLAQLDKAIVDDVEIKFTVIL